jgi:hypothetical protein
MRPAKSRAVSPVVPLPFAVLKVNGSYPTRTGKENHFFGKHHEEHFVLKCQTPNFYRQEAGVLPDWRGRLCVAILDYNTAPRRNSNCFCPVSATGVTVQGTINSRAVRYFFSPCTCGLGRRAAHDVHVVLTTHRPPGG